MKHFSLFQIMKPFRLIPLFLIAAFVSSCDDDDDDKDNVTPTVEIAGTYEYESATFTEDVTFKEATLPAGTSADSFVEVYLNLNSPCVDPDDTQLELREGGKLFLSCGNDGGSAVESGSWSVNTDKTELTISFTSNPPISLTIENIRLESDDDGDKDDFKLYGNIIGFPVPINPDEPISASNIQLVAVDIVLDKED